MPEPRNVREIYIVVRQDEEKAGFRPNSHEKRSKKFFSLAEARKLKRYHGDNAKLYRAEVGPWIEID